MWNVSLIINNNWGGVMDVIELGCFDFVLNFYMNRCSARMGVYERYYIVNLY